MVATTSKDEIESSGGTRPLRVVINGLHAKSGGGVTYLRNILPELARLPDLELHLILHEDQVDLFQPIAGNVRVTPLRFRPTLLRTLIWEQVKVPMLARKLGAQVVFSPANYGPLLARNHVILLRNAVSVVKLTRQWKPIVYWLGLSVATILSLLTARKAIAVSHYAKKLLSFGLDGILGDKVQVAYHGTRQDRREWERGAGHDGYLLAVSDIYIQKNYGSLLRAFALLVTRHPDLKLVIAGREIDPDYARSLHRLCDELGLGRNVLFRGHVETDELCELYRKCRAFVFPSVVETFGNSLVEAMAAGVPIACSREAAMPEVLGDAGVTFDPWDHRDMADQIERLLSDDALSARLGKLARQRARAFDWRSTALRTCSVLKAAAGPAAIRQSKPSGETVL